MSYNRKRYTSSTSVIDTETIYDVTQQKLQSEINAENNVKDFSDTATDIKMDGSQAAGSSTKAARADHVHPKDTSKADKSATVSTVAYDSTNHKLTKTINGTTTDVMTVDTTPTDNSMNPISSDAVYDLKDAINDFAGDIPISTEAGLIRKSCNFRADANIVLGSTGVTLENYARGEIISADGSTGCIIAVGYGGKAYFAFFESGIIRNAKIFTTDSPTFTGTPTAPTQNAQDSSTKIATTAFVQGHVSDLNTAINDFAGDIPISTEAGLIRKSCNFRADANIVLGSTGVTLENYARGEIISADGSNGCIIAVGYSGNVYAAYFAGGVFARAQVYDNRGTDITITANPTYVSSASGITCKRTGNVVTFSGSIVMGATAITDNLLFSGFPSPSSAIDIFGTVVDATDTSLRGKAGRYRIKTDGTLVPWYNTWGAADVGSTVFFNASYII